MMSGVLQIQEQNEEIISRLKDLEEKAAPQSSEAAESMQRGEPVDSEGGAE